MTSDKPVLYEDKKYSLVRFDSLNFAIIDKLSFSRNTVIGYYPRLKEALTALIEILAENDFASKVAGSSKIRALSMSLVEVIEDYHQTLVRMAARTYKSINIQAL